VTLVLAIALASRWRSLLAGARFSLAGFSGEAAPSRLMTLVSKALRVTAVMAGWCAHCRHGAHASENLAAAYVRCTCEDLNRICRA